MSGQNNMYGSQDDPFGYGQQQAYWQKQRADDASAAKPVPIKQPVPTTPQVQPRPTPEGPPVYQSPYGRGYVPPNGGTQTLPNPGAAQVPVPPSQLPQWAVQRQQPQAPNISIGGGPRNLGSDWYQGPDGKWRNPSTGPNGMVLDAPPAGLDPQYIHYASTQPPSGIWNGPVPPKQELPEDIYGFSKIYGAPIPEGQTWNQWNPRVGYNPWGGQQGQWQTQAIPQWYGARLNQVR